MTDETQAVHVEETWFSLVNRCKFDPTPDAEHLINIHTETNPPTLQFGQAVYDMLKANGWQLVRGVRNEPTFDYITISGGADGRDIIIESRPEEPSLTKEDADSLDELTTFYDDTSG